MYYRTYNIKKKKHEGYFCCANYVNYPFKITLPRHVFLMHCLCNKPLWLHCVDPGVQAENVYARLNRTLWGRS